MNMFAFTTLLSVATIAAGIGCACLILESKGIAISDYLKYIKFILLAGSGIVAYIWYVVLIIFLIYMFMHPVSNLLASAIVVIMLCGIADNMYRY